jgi:AcrR family transcriptional regulator
VPAPRRKSARGDRRRRQIVEAALAEIRAEAVADVQLAAIAARADLRPSHVLYYFGSRDEVLIAAVAHAEERLASGRGERLRAIADDMERLAAFVDANLPADRHDPVWKLWIEGWLRSPSRAEFTAVGREADQGWMVDLIDCVEHVTATGGVLPEPVPVFARRFIWFLDGLAVHVLADHITRDEAAAHAMESLRSRLR